MTRLLPSCRWQSTRPSFVEHSSEIETNWAAKERRGERESGSRVNRSKGEMKHLPNRLNDFLFSPKCHITLSHIRFSVADVYSSQVDFVQKYRSTANPPPLCSLLMQRIRLPLCRGHRPVHRICMYVCPLRSAHSVQVQFHLRSRWRTSLMHRFRSFLFHPFSRSQKE